MQVSTRAEQFSLSKRLRQQSRTRGRMTLIMGLFGVAFIFITFGYIAWEQRQRLIENNEEEIRNSAYFLADHTARLLEVTDLTLKQSSALIQDENWDSIETSKRLWNQLRAIKEALPYIDHVWLNDAAGRLRMTSAQFPAPIAYAAERDAFVAQIGSDKGLFIGEPILGRVTRDPTFMISRRLQDEDRSFRGVVSVTLALSYFNQYWGKVHLPRGSRVTLLRASDAKVIAQYPSPPDGISFVPVQKQAFDQALLSRTESGTYPYSFDGLEYLAAYNQAGRFPLYIIVSMPEDAYWRPWLIQTRLYGAFALIAFLALLALTALASQQFREQAANAALLEKQVALRTKELQTETTALEILNRTGSALASELEIERIIANVVDAGVQLTGAQVGAFFTNTGLSQNGRDGGGEVLLHYVANSDKAGSVDFPVSAVSPAAFEQGRIMLLDDIASTPDCRRMLFGDHASSDVIGIRSVMTVPIMPRTGKIQGVLLFGHKRPGVFKERAERLVGGLAAQAAIALDNGSLYQDAQREIEDRKQAQAQQSLLIRELHHRVKNTLATVQAVVGATARSTSNVDEFYKAFVGRIISLANTHSLLTEAVWQTASLREILEKELSPYNDVKTDRIVLAGPDVELPSEAAVPIGMAVHELTTNAVKYGALSASTGQVVVSWSAEERPDGLQLRLVWQEKRGPKVSPPSRQGFGSRLLHRVLATQLNAEVGMSFEETGLRVSIDAVLKPTHIVNPIR